jgi:hypothetical protein
VRELPQSFRELVDVIQFTEQVSAKLHGILDEDEIFDTVVDEFRGSGKYIVAILLLSDDPSRLLIRGISLPVKLLRMAEKATGLKIADFEIELGRSEAYSRVIEGGETIEGVIVGEVIAQVVPRPVALVATRILGVSNKMHILTPLRRQGRIIGLIGMDSTTLGKHLIPSVKNLALHISGALDLATEISRRRLAEDSTTMPWRRFARWRRNASTLFWQQGSPPVGRAPTRAKKAGQSISSHSWGLSRRKER